MMPSALSGEGIAGAAQAARWARTERIDASLTGPLRFTVAHDDGLWAVDELRVQQDFGVTVDAQDLPLGAGQVRIAVAVLDVEGPDDQGLVTVTARAQREQIVFVLSAPLGRRLPAVRTQTPWPRPGPADESAAKLTVPVVGHASQRLPAALDAVAASPVATAPSTAELLDDLRDDAT